MRQQSLSVHQFLCQVKKEAIGGAALRDACVILPQDCPQYMQNTGTARVLRRRAGVFWHTLRARVRLFLCA